LFPSLAADARADPDLRHARARRTQCLSVGLGAAVTVALVAFGPWLTTTLYGPAFAPSRAAVRVLALAVVPSTVATHQSLALLATRREIVTLRVLAVCALVLAVLLAVLVPVLGWIGACWSVVLAETVHATLLTRAARREPS
jgi:O-antigen/teichoic acid export membrane protein